MILLLLFAESAVPPEVRAHVAGAAAAILDLALPTNTSARRRATLQATLAKRLAALT